MSIQLQRNFPDSSSRDFILSTYKKSLQAEVKNFTTKEKDFIIKAISEIYTSSAYDLNTILNFPVDLLKISGLHYGDGVYYTRENCILIPQDELDLADLKDFSNVMRHELFHVYSRLHPEKRKALYQLIGYKKISKPQHLQMNEQLQSRILLNPDGINYAYAIQLTENKKSFFALPIIISSKESFDPTQPDFFDYVQFDLYKIQPSLSKLIKVEADNNGQSLIDFKEFPDFWNQIGDNTDYIIHPDEVLADNFIYLLEGPESWKKFSPRGQEILKEMEQIIFGLNK